MERNVYHALLAITLCVSCTAPNIEEGQKSFATNLDAATEGSASIINKGRKNEADRVKNRLINNQEAVYEEPTSCVAASFGVTRYDSDSEFTPGDCKLQPTFSAPIKYGTAAYAADGLKALKSYSDVLAAINSSKVGPETAKSLSSMVTSANAFRAAADPNSSAFIKEAEIAPISSLMGQYIEARRARLLKRLVNTANDDILYIVSELIVYFEPYENLEADSQDLWASYRRMTDAQDGNSVSAYRNAVRSYERTFAAYEKKLRDSHTARLLAVWKSQQLIHKQVNDPKDIDGIVSLVSDLDAIKSN